MTDDVTAITQQTEQTRNILRVCSSSARASSLCCLWNALKENQENQREKVTATVNVHANFQCLLCTPASNVINVKSCTQRKISGSIGCGNRSSCLLLLKDICLRHKHHHLNIRHTYGATSSFTGGFNTLLQQHKNMWNTFTTFLFCPVFKIVLDHFFLGVINHACAHA